VNVEGDYDYGGAYVQQIDDCKSRDKRNGIFHRIDPWVGKVHDVWCRASLHSEMTGSYRLGYHDRRDRIQDRKIRYGVLHCGDVVLVVVDHNMRLAHDMVPLGNQICAWENELDDLQDAIRKEDCENWQTVVMEQAVIDQASENAVMKDR
jgi:hypothetical protein